MPHEGEHRTPEGVTKFGDNGIVVQPQPLEDFGGGKGHFVSPNSTTLPPAPAPAKKSNETAAAPAPAPAEKKKIIVEPVPATEAGGQAFVAQPSATVQRAVETGTPIQVAAPPSASLSADGVLGSVAASLSAGAFPASAVLAATAIPRGTPAAPTSEVTEVVIQIPASDAVQVNGHLQLTPAAVQKLLKLGAVQTVPAKVASPHTALAAAQGKAAVSQAAPVHLQAVQSSPARVEEKQATPTLKASSAHETHVAHAAAKTSSSSQTLSIHKPVEKGEATHHVANPKVAVQPTAPVQHAADQQKDHHVVSHPSKATALSVTAKTTGKSKDLYKGFLSGFVNF